VKYVTDLPVEACYLSQRSSARDPRRRVRKVQASTDRFRL